MVASFGYGQATPWDTSDQTNSLFFVVRQLIAQISTMTLVKVTAVNVSSEIAPSGTVDVQPLVSQIDGQGNTVEHGIVRSIPFYRLQGGLCAVICNPVVGDVGYVICADRDSSAVRVGSGVVAPGSYRKYNVADGVYVGGVWNAEPTCYVLLKPDGHLKVVDASGNVLESSASGFTLTGTLRVTGNVIAGFGGIDQVGLQTHTHLSNNFGLPTSSPTAGT